MGVSESEIISHDEVESPLQSDQQATNHFFSSLGRQSSIYSLTLDEFQHTLCENGKNFGSMNMDEFLTSIWTAEENQAINSNHTNINNNHNHHNSNINNIDAHMPSAEASEEKAAAIAKQPSLPRQGSLTLPGPLCRKTVDEVWSEIHKGQQAKQQNSHSSNDGVQNSEFAPRQPTFGEMTLEDFLVKAGVVREPDSMLAAGAVPPPQPQQQQQQYGMYQNSNQAVGPSFANRPVMGMGAAGTAGASTSTAAGMPNYQGMPQNGATVVAESSGYAANGKRNGAYPAVPPPQAVCFGGRVVNGGGGYAAGQPIGMAAPVSPVSSDGMCTSQVENSGGQFGFDMGGLRGRKRILDGPVEKVVERRQRRMIKNRESAARSRARKQAYTVELEAELNQLREENAHLKQALSSRGNESNSTLTKCKREFRAGPRKLRRSCEC
ncbi:PREDICTED: protein ABSCISIC ACID-INSENSITIVE 5 isoform X2 [Prunus mume]|uniref:Protein ABSCISIC ACID-INSENSITIVE 5 isoform X2 n=1 Tax=Prunus mume TaxID=102107 RepID=A0ABM1LW73_PRUMU|nr:PREDICTED: protein ABSCISIC ACID-INSENSITIVE 5 isoform X2 [Prunus mume]